MEKIRVLLVDDDISWQSAMGRFLSRQKDIILSGMVKTGREAIEFVKSIPVDIALMDINLTENKLDGIEVVLELHKFSNIKIIMLTSIKLDEIIIDSFTAGAVNFLYKEDYRILPNAIRNVYNNTTPYEVLLKDYNKLKKEEQVKNLSICEKEIFAMMEDCKSRRQMQDELNKSENTVKKLIRQVLRKLDVSCSKEAVEKVNRKGINMKLK